MKTFVFLIMSLLVFWGCIREPEDSNQNEIGLISSTYNGCLKSISADDTPVESYLISALGDQNYRIDHLNASFNCCLPEGIAFGITQKNDTLFITDYEKVPGNCRCMCVYNTEAIFNNLEDGNYILCLSTGEKKVGSVEIYFDETLNTEIDISELSEY